MDVEVKTQVPVRVNDQNFCDENPIGAVTRNISSWHPTGSEDDDSRRGDEPGRYFMTFGFLDAAFFPEIHFLQTRC